MDKSKKRAHVLRKPVEGFWPKIWYSVKGLILDERTGQVVGSKLAATAGHASLAFWFSWLTFHNGFIEMLWLIYAAIFTGHKVFEKLIGMKYDVKNSGNFNLDLPSEDYPDRSSNSDTRWDNSEDNMGSGRR